MRRVGQIMFLVTAAAVGSAVQAADDLASACGVGRRVALEDGTRGVVTSTGTITGCYVKLDDGSLVASYPEQMRFEDSAGSAAPKADSTTPALGVYECTTPGVGINAAAMFGLVDAQTYRNFNGKSGRYSFDTGSATLALLSGDSAGLRYRRASARSFRLLEDDDKLSGTHCVLNTAKDVNGGPW